MQKNPEPTQEEEFDLEADQVKEVKTLTPKQLKAIIKPKFQAEPDKYYPTGTLGKLGYTRNQCPKCEKFYYRVSEKQDTCGDTSCVGKYTFIGKGAGIGIGRKEKITYAEAWKTYEESFTA